LGKEASYLLNGDSLAGTTVTFYFNYPILIPDAGLEFFKSKIYKFLLMLISLDFTDLNYF
jgi:hypothetical protein